jgi:hypothetical protein
MAKKNEKYTVIRRLYDADAGLRYALHVFGDDLAKRKHYTGLDGIEAVQYYLIQKHNWLPRDVKSMSSEDLYFVMTEEMAKWHMPIEARQGALPAEA